MRYRIIIEIDTDKNREWVNKLAENMMDYSITSHSTPVYLATEMVTDKQRSILRETD